MSKAIIVSDVHLHKWQYGATVSTDGYNSRLLQQYSYLNSLTALADVENAKHIICLGDLFHTHQTVHAEVLAIASFVVQHYARNGIKFHCLVGNHDMASKDGVINSLNWLRSYGTLVDRPTRFQIEGRLISALPYTEDEEKLTDFLKSAEELVLLHQGVNLHDRGSAWVLNEIFTKEMVPTHVRKVLTGHYHKPVDDGKISIVGSTMQHNWSDYDDAPRGCMILDLDTLATKRVENNINTRFMKWDFKGEWNANVHNCFVKAYNVPKDKMEYTRAAIIGNGAVSVEFDMPNLSMETEENVKPAASTIEDILAEYDKQVDGRQLTVGKLLREQQYAAPKV